MAQDNLIPLKPPQPSSPSASDRPPKRSTAAAKRNLKLYVRALPWAAALLIAFAVAAWWSIPFVFGVSVKPDFVVREEIVQTVVSSGRVETPRRVQIGAQITGTVVEVHPENGDSVNRGDVLVVLDATEAQAAADQARAGLRLAEVKLRHLREVTVPSARERLKQARANLVAAQHVFDRVQVLERRGVATSAQLEEAQRGLDIARAQIMENEIQIASNDVGGSAHQLAELELEQQRAALRSAEARLQYTKLEAPADAIVIQRNIEVGDVVQPGKSLLILAPRNETRLVVQIDERNLGLISIGDPAKVSTDAFPAQIFEARVASIDPSVDAQRGSVLVKLSVPDPPAYLREDMTISIDIEVDRRSNALVLPTSSLRDINGQKGSVLRIEQGRAMRREVHIGARGRQKVEILEGLSEGDAIVPTTASNVKEGTKVQMDRP